MDINACIAKLSSISLPPADSIPSNVLDDLHNVESSLSSSLPEDYKALIATYGIGVFQDFLVLLGPSSKIRDFSILGVLNEHHISERSQRLNFPDEQSIVEPFYLYPEQKGLIPWGFTTNDGCYLYWQTIGSPNEWPVIVYNLRDGEHEFFALTVTEFLIGVLSRDLIVNLFPRSFPASLPIKFVPARTS